MSEIDLSSPLNYGTPSSLGSIRTPRSGVRGTPIRQRTDIRTDKHMRQVNLSEPVNYKYLLAIIIQTITVKTIIKYFCFLFRYLRNQLYQVLQKVKMQVRN